MENAVENTIEAVGGLEGIKQKAIEIAEHVKQPIKNTWHVYWNREQYEYYNISMYNQFTDNQADCEFISVDRTYVPAF